MAKLLIATNNRGKLREYRLLLGDTSYELTSLDAEGISEKVEETGTTYEENAKQKALTYASVSKLLTLADDSGLEVDALGGLPGPRAARFAGEGASDEDRVRVLLHTLEGVPWEKRGAHFICVIAIASPEGWIEFTEGSCEGVITFEPKGDLGFGYDPIFFVPQYGRTMAELAPEEKNTISHRAVAARKAAAILRRLSEEE